MKKMPCKYPACGNRRIHHERQDVMRGTQLCDVPDHVTDADPVFCSITCACMDGWMAVSGGLEKQQELQDAWRQMNAERL